MIEATLPAVSDLDTRRLGHVSVQNSERLSCPSRRFDSSTSYVYDTLARRSPQGESPADVRRIPGNAGDTLATLDVTVFPRAVEDAI